jgi:flagellar protein FliO/FliZ
MDWDTLPDLVKLAMSLGLVIALMGGLAFILKRLGLAGAQPEAQANKRLKVLERLPLDARRQLVLLKRDNTQHLVILSASGETVVETNIEDQGEN